MILPIIVAVVTAIGIAFILFDVMKVPSYAVSKATHNLGKKQNKKTNPLEVWLGEIANWISGKLRLNEYKRMHLDADLKTADMNMTPEMYVADNIVKSLFIGILAIPVFFFSKGIATLIIFCAFLMYYNNSKKVSNRIKEKRRLIEYELPRFVSTIEKTLVHNRDVLGILDAYKDSAGPELRRELEITVADMRSGNYEIALTRLESRVGSSMLSDITRGLVSVIRGDDTAVYWGSLVLKFSDYQRQNLKAEADKAPKRVRRLSMVLLVCFTLIYQKRKQTRWRAERDSEC